MAREALIEDATTQLTANAEGTAYDTFLTSLKDEVKSAEGLVTTLTEQDHGELDAYIFALNQAIDNTVEAKKAYATERSQIADEIESSKYDPARPITEFVATQQARVASSLGGRPLDIRMLIQALASDMSDDRVKRTLTNLLLPATTGGATGAAAGTTATATPESSS
jgi:hypothetical protein